MPARPHDGAGTAGEPTFEERQSLPSWLVPALVALSVPGLAFTAFVVLDEQGLTLESLATVALIAVIVLGPIPLIGRSTLHTAVRADGVYFRFRPFHRSDRRISFEAIERIERSERRAYQYGLRRTRWGWEYRPHASDGVEIYRTRGPAIFLGSERPHELWTAIEAELRRADREAT